MPARKPKMKPAFTEVVKTLEPVLPKATDMTPREQRTAYTAQLLSAQTAEVGALLSQLAAHEDAYARQVVEDARASHATPGEGKSDATVLLMVNRAVDHTKRTAAILDQASDALAAVAASILEAGMQSLPEQDDSTEAVLRNAEKAELERDD